MAIVSLYPVCKKSPELLARTQTNNASPIPESACSPCFSFFSRASTEGDPSEKTEVARPKSRRQKTVHQDINMTCHVRQNCAVCTKATQKIILFTLHDRCLLLWKLLLFWKVSPVVETAFIQNVLLKMQYQGRKAVDQFGGD